MAARGVAHFGGFVVIEFRPFGLSPLVCMAGCFVLLVVVLVMRGVLVRASEKKSPVTAGLVIGVVGRPGSGKTYFAARTAYERLEAGARVVTNFSMTLPPEWEGRWQQWSGWDDVGRLQDCVVVLDEAHLIAPSTQGFALPDVARWWLSQVRRFGCEMIWISQNEMRVSKTLRDLTNYIWVANSYRHGKSFKLRLYEPEKLGKPDQHLELRRYRFDPKIGRIFDSWEILGGTETRDAAAGARIRQLADERNAHRRTGTGADARGRTVPAGNGGHRQGMKRNGYPRAGGREITK